MKTLFLIVSFAVLPLYATVNHKVSPSLYSNLPKKPTAVVVFKEAKPLCYSPLNSRLLPGFWRENISPELSLHLKSSPSSTNLANLNLRLCSSEEKDIFFSKTTEQMVLKKNLTPTDNKMAVAPLAIGVGKFLITGILACVASKDLAEKMGEKAKKKGMANLMDTSDYDLSATDALRAFLVATNVKAALLCGSLNFGLAYI